MRVTLDQNQSVQRYTSLTATVLLSIIVALIASPASGTKSISDQQISDQVNREFLFDPVVSFNTVDVQTTEGIVSLKGRVDNLLAKERAARIAETVRGVRSVINRLDVVPIEEKTAKALRRDVESALIFDEATDAYEIDVKAKENGEVTLSGTVDSWSEKQLADTVTKSVSGVTDVNNRITVIAKANRPASEITADIKKRLHWDTLVDDGMIDVRVDEGDVILSGTVGSAAEKRHAEQNAWVSGVKSVDTSKLAVSKWARDKALRDKKYIAKSDAEISEAVKDALVYDPRVYLHDIDVTTSAGVVTLRGVVDNIEAKQAAERDARHTVGVRNIHNLIKVRPVAELSDKKIADNIRTALIRNPFTESYEVDVKVKNQMVTLSGTVDSFFEKAEAENTAFRAKGVVGVKNKLLIDRPTLIVYDPYVYDWSIYDYPWYNDTAVIFNRSDWQIELNIINELIWSPYVDRDDVSVSVADGVATLEGEVESWSEYTAAQENAFEGGATAVINRLKVIYRSA